MPSQVQDQNRKFYEDFGIRISFIREKRGLTLAKIADGKSSTAKSWESGVKPKPDKWESIAEMLGLSVSFIFLGSPVSQRDYDFIAKFADEIGSPAMVQEQRQGYTSEGKPLKGDSLAKNSQRGSLDGAPAMTLNPRFQPAAEHPSKETCLAYFKEYMDRAAREEGGVGYAFRLLKKTFPLDEFDPVEKSPKHHG